MTPEEIREIMGSNTSGKTDLKVFDKIMPRIRKTKGILQRVEEDIAERRRDDAQFLSQQALALKDILEGKEPRALPETAFDHFMRSSAKLSERYVDILMGDDKGEESD